MATTSGDSYGLFWNSNNGDRVYNANSLELWLKKFFTSGVFTGDCQVLASSGYVVSVGAGYANVNGKVMIFGSETLVTLDPPNSTYPRIDTIVIERNNSDREITVKKVTGVYAGTSPQPTAPVRNTDVYQLVLAQVYVSAGASEITQSNITDTRADTDICGYVITPINTFDFGQYILQFNAYLAEFKETTEADFDAWSAQEKSDFETWERTEKTSFEEWKSEQETGFEAWESQEQEDYSTWSVARREDFDEWFATIQDILDESVAGHLQSEIDDIKSSYVTKFNGRSGSVLPVAGDYDSSQITHEANSTVEAYLGKWTTPVSCLTGDTSVTISNDAIHTTSVIRAYSETASGTPVGLGSMVVSEGQAVITFASALAEAANIRLQILNI